MYSRASCLFPISTSQLKRNFLVVSLSKKYVLPKRYKHSAVWKRPLNSSPVFSQTVDAYQIGMRVDAKEARMEIFLRMYNPDSASSRDILEQFNKLLGSYIPKKTEPPATNNDASNATSSTATATTATTATSTTSTTTTTTTKNSYFSKFSSYVPTKQISSVVTSTTSAASTVYNSVSGGVVSIGSMATSHFYTSNRFDEIDVQCIWIPKFGIVYYKSYEPIQPQITPSPTDSSTPQLSTDTPTPNNDTTINTLTNPASNIKDSTEVEPAPVKPKRYKEICYEFDADNTKGAEKLLDPSVPVDEKIGRCVGILVDNVSKIPLSGTIAEKLSSKLTQIFLRRR